MLFPAHLFVLFSLQKGPSETGPDIYKAPVKGCPIGRRRRRENNVKNQKHIHFIVKNKSQGKTTLAFVFALLLKILTNC